MLNILEIKSDTEPNSSVSCLIERLHKEGPINNEVIQAITYYKLFHIEVFKNYEERLLSVLGLFYKNESPSDLFSFLLSGIGQENKKRFGALLTPVQASVRQAVEDYRYTSISAPTSAGKSFSIRDYIFEQEKDSVIVVPSRALIAEYMTTLRDRFKNDKTVMISSFVDHVFTSRSLRRIFVLTPERARELFSYVNKLDISLFFFDEAQVSEEAERGVIFDVLVRRVQRAYPNAKLVFAHPFVDNPDAQMKKHNLNENLSYARSYQHNTVGKAFIFGHNNKKDYYFSPFKDKGHLVRNSIQLEEKFEKIAFDGKHTVLVYVSKASLYRGDFINEFQKYVDKFDVILDAQAISLIEEVEVLIGANEQDHHSNLVALLKKGVVIHHGSVPLEVRFLIEDFIRLGFAKICFATSTLAQGINMPFDVVWLDNMRMLGGDEADRALAFKNLIGRSGRLSKDAIFDFGYVYTKNPILLSERLNTPFILSEESLLEQDVEGMDDERELISSIIDGTFNESMNLPSTKVERLSSDQAIKLMDDILSLIYGTEFGVNLFGEKNRDNRIIVKDCLRYIYEISLDRKLYAGERNVFNTAIEIFFHVIQGRSFKEIVGIRYAYLANRGQDQNLYAKFSQPANKLPDSGLINEYPLFKEIKSKDVSYDAVVFDTYDYLDTVISFSLSDVFIGAFNIFHTITKDPRALKMAELLRYGTNDTTYTLLLRYGFPPEEIKEISNYVELITEENILFKPEIFNCQSNVRDLVDWYLP
ncbi:helicase [Photobacterium angustum]|uniref:DEAD/DEAH box helicase n=1 Tax=Photobacterium angustum TaxID=661 RepID=UPI0005E8E9EF|nr:DEAD/DEAH box helicase [Photobacterium angustum]KJG07917.1 helicase [Photobacterium angustum]PSV94859.1 helicase [Photobacterium angustum]